ncbi:bestrophin family protein [Moraxella sp. FZLJ2107]|uniref:bestrophin family protein n=1 Tax=unclassified Moraxella TaxID=2685852 RepID=UPI0020C91F16|nr:MULTISPECIES: bestrophin family protein [unclassified Moraxella]UTO05311.1 bestrophin family protein [Moraxella sp. FZLJ2107]UTO22046.1 bestrophin family protein [Moraxella sp. FZLJ2109]
MIVRDKSNSLKLLFVWHGTVLPKVLPVIIGIMSLSMVAWALAHFRLYHVHSVPAVGFTLLGVVISIFLGFRNNACYDRWWEGRKLWGALIANTRHFTRDTHFLPPAVREQLLMDMLLFVSLLRDRLRQQKITRAQFTYQAIDNTRLDALDTHFNAPQKVLEAMQKQLIDAVNQGQISDIIYTSIHKHLIEMGGIQAGCDRILSTPLPFPYSVLLHRAVYCFCWILPFGLESVMGIWTPLLVGFLSYLLLGLDELSQQLEEPFGNDDHNLPLDTIVRLIERETLSLMDKPLPDAWRADQYYNYS